MCFLCDEEAFVFMMGRLRSVSATVGLLGREREIRSQRRQKRDWGGGGGEQSLRKSEKQSFDALQGRGAGTFGTGSLKDTLVRMSVGVS